MTRTLRRWTAVLAMLGLLLAQLSAVAYACPVDAGYLPPQAAAPAHADCAGAPPPIDGALCELHCQVAASVPSASAPDLAVPVVTPLVVGAAPARAAPDRASPQRLLPDALAAAPPVAIRYCRLLV